MKLFNLFKNNFSNNEEGAKLEIYCYDLESGEVENLIPQLEKKGFELIYIDADSLMAKISGGYQDITGLMKELKEQGFSWSEKE